MAKPKSLDPKTRAMRAIKRHGVDQDLIDKLELAILREVTSHGSISGNASAYTLDRIEELEEKDDF